MAALAGHRRPHRTDAPRHIAARHHHHDRDHADHIMLLFVYVFGGASAPGRFLCEHMLPGIC
jgi:hypothetical protein